MIPRVELTDEIFVNPLKTRVTACRKRLRDHRSAQRTETPEADSAKPDASAMGQFPADSPVVRQLVNLDLSPAFGKDQECDRAGSVEVQEVGIT